MAGDAQFQSYYETRNKQKAITSDNPHNRVLIETIANALKIQACDRVLDVGCSDGYILERLMDKCQFREGVGVDISLHSVELASRLVAKYRNIAFFASPADRLPFGDSSFDKVVCNEVIEHVPNDYAVLQEIARVCKPGGRVYLTAPNAFESMLPLFVGHCRRVDRMEGHLRRYSAKSMEELATSTGFTLEELQYNGFLASFVWYSTIIYNVKLKSALLSLITWKSSKRSASVPRLDVRPQFGMLSKVAFAIMELVMALDRPFRKLHSNMGFFVVLRKR